MRMTLLIVEQAFRGAVESQYSHPVWYAQMHGRMSDVADLLLLGESCCYALRNRVEQKLRFGEKRLDVIYDFERSMINLLESGTEVYVYEEDCKNFGYSAEMLNDGVTVLDRDGLLDAIESHEFVMYA